MFFGVSKSGSPISRCTTSLPSASSARARASTSKAVSVPSRLMDAASLKAIVSSLSGGMAGASRDRDAGRTPDRAVLEAGLGHRLGVVQVAAVDHDRLAQRAAQPLEVELLELVPFGHQEQR